jgi:hypothetical protein
MPISKSVYCLLIIVCALALAAQTTSTTATSAIETVGTNPAATSTTTKSTTTTTTTKKVTHKKLKAVPLGKTAVHENATRLASLLADTQSSASLSEASWKVIANEANMLANRLYAETGGNATAHKAATDARAHVREMHAAAMKGDAAGAKAHASMALPFVYTLIDWSAPKTT